MATAALALPEPQFVGHPRGLAYLAFAEMFERFSYYGMQTLLVLYMAATLLHPGHVENIIGFASFRGFIEGVYGRPLSITALGSAVFGIYAGLVYLTPIIGGTIADRWLGRTRTITIGALLMTAGHFLMAFEAPFLLALLCLCIGVGAFKGNMAAQVGNLYHGDDPRRADAFQIYTLIFSGGAIAAPLIAGTLGEVYGWHYGFAAAGVGMVCGLLIYLSGRKYLPPEPPRRIERILAPPLSRRERRAITLLVLLLPVLAFGLIGNLQVNNAYLLWAQRDVDLMFFGLRMPTSWLVTIDAAVSVGSIMASIAFWRWWARDHRPPAEIAKMAIGLAIASLALLTLAAGAALAGDGKVDVAWLLLFHLLNAIGMANIIPVGLALYSRVAPAALSGTMIGIYYIHLFMSNNIVGWLGGLIEWMPPVQFWLLHAGLVAGSATLVFVVSRRFAALLTPDDRPALP